MTKPEIAVEEIKAILEKYDLAGIVFVQEPKTTAYLHKIDPSWSCAHFEETPQGLAIRIRSHLEDYPSKEAQAESITATCGMVMSFMSQAERTAEDYRNLAQMLGTRFGIRFWERENDHR